MDYVASYIINARVVALVTDQYSFVIVELYVLSTYEDNPDGNPYCEVYDHQKRDNGDRRKRQAIQDGDFGMVMSTFCSQSEIKGVFDISVVRIEHQWLSLSSHHRQDTNTTLCFSSTATDMKERQQAEEKRKKSQYTELTQVSPRYRPRGGA